MTPEQTQQLAFIKALRELGAVHVRAGDVECRFDPLTMVPTELPQLFSVTAGGAEVSELQAELRRYKRLLGVLEGEAE